LAKDKLETTTEAISDTMFCYNCVNYNRETQNCNAKNLQMHEKQSCIDYNKTKDINLTKEEIDDIIIKGNKKNKTLNKQFSAFTPYDSVKAFYNLQPFFYDKNRLFWFWNAKNYSYEIVDEIDLMNQLEKDLELQGQTFGSKLKGEYLECFKRIGRLKKPEEPLKEWIQFKDKIYDLKTERTFYANEKYFFTNPIGWEIGERPYTPVMDGLFKEWVGEEYVQTLYELLAYCCYRSYPIQLLFCLWGNGRNGKSQFLKILDKFIGFNNATSTELDLLVNNRFESFKLYKKLTCLIGETNFGVLNNTSIIKKLTGGDKIGFEKKNKDPFDDYNYAKMIIASNSLPSSQDTSDGFYRRWLIIDFPNEFEDLGQEVWEKVPKEEYENLAKKVVLILGDLLNKGMFTNQGSISQRRKKYMSVSNPLGIFIKEKCFVKSDLYVLYSKFYTEYLHYLQINKRRRISRKEFKSALEDEGFIVEKTTKEFESGYYILGMKIID